MNDKARCKAEPSGDSKQGKDMPAEDMKEQAQDNALREFDKVAADILGSPANQGLLRYTENLSESPCAVP